jgi:uncharacterized protein (DUF433 family)
MGGRDHERRTRLVDVAEMARLYREGATIATLAAAAQRSYTWTRRLLLNAGVELRGRPAARACGVSVEQLAAEYADGASILTLADRHGLYFRQVRDLLLAHGVVLRPSTRAGRRGQA